MKEIGDAIRGGLLDGREIRTVTTPAGVELPVIEVAKDEWRTAWHAARAVVHQTGRYPIVVADLEDGDSIFPAGRPPDEILADAAALDMDAAIAEGTANRVDHGFVFRGQDGRRLEIQAAIDDHGAELTVQDVEEAGAFTTKLELERWFLEWEEEHLDPLPSIPAPGWSDWAGGLAVAFLPDPRPWVFPAYIGTYFANAEFAHLFVALAHRWHGRHGAEGVASWVVTACFRASRPPKTVDDAFQLAIEHRIVARQTAGMSSCRDYARSLIGAGEWELFERP